MTLTQDALIALNRLGEKYQQHLHHVFSQLPRHAHSIGGLRKETGYNRSNSQRIVTAKNAKDGLKVLYSLPGVEGQYEFCQRISTYLEKRDIEKLQAFIEQFSDAVQRFARSHAGLKRLLENNTAIQAQDSNLLSRRQLFMSASTLLGTSVDSMFCCFALTPRDDNSTYLHEQALISKEGMRRSTKAPPFVQFYTHENPDGEQAPRVLQRGEQLLAPTYKVAVAGDLTTDGVDENCMSYPKGQSGVVFDECVPNPFNAGFVFSNPEQLINPLTGSSRCTSTSVSIRLPTKKLNMLVLVDKTLNQQSSVNIGCYLGNSTVNENHLRSSDMWTDRLPDFPKLKVVEFAGLASSFNSRSFTVNKLDYFVNCFGLDKTRYSAYLLDVDFPIWSATYRVYFEHQE
ncbi:hypothetical protein CS022_00660 [Veronia nyctiphanis]|uniref:Uncharacterized protein n=1 Tax=Veronia nyctiphanis TaxID=1278244 RepID=A0A4Q0YU03_9GAMM|nr:hypothetical protein [Veronia nyctiphanis]RXJ74772.1 hypothetical protein CS022_00660 [Veronia nyctiphanis]